MVYAYRIAEIFSQAINDLGSQSYFRQQVQYLLTLRYGLVYQFDIDFRLAARSYPVQKSNIFCFKSQGHPFDSLHLFVAQSNRAY